MSFPTSASKVTISHSRWSGLWSLINFMTFPNHQQSIKDDLRKNRSVRKSRLTGPHYVDGPSSRRIWNQWQTWYLVPRDSISIISSCHELLARVHWSSSLHETQELTITKLFVNDRLSERIDGSSPTETVWSAFVTLFRKTKNLSNKCDSGFKSYIGYPKTTRISYNLYSKGSVGGRGPSPLIIQKNHRERGYLHQVRLIPNITQAG